MGETGEIWEPDALTAHVRIYEGPAVNAAKYQPIQAPSKYWMANRESNQYDKPKRPRSTHPNVSVHRPRAVLFLPLAVGELNRSANKSFPHTNPR